MIRSCAVVVTAMSLASAAIADAQCAPGGPPNPAARRGALTGIVMDSSHLVIEGAEVFVDKPVKRTRSAVDGRFVVDNVDPGTYTVSCRRGGREARVGVRGPAVRRADRHQDEASHARMLRHYRWGPVATPHRRDSQ